MYYGKTVEQIAHELKTNPKTGLKNNGVKASLDQYGTNRIKIKTKPLILVILEPFLDIFTFMLIIAGLLGLAQGHIFDAVLVAAILIIDSGIYYFQRFSTSRILSSLRKTIPQKVTVLRNGQKVELQAEKLVVGDIVYLCEGEKIPADGRIISASGLLVNESILTGETEPIHKDSQVLLGKKPIYEQSNMLFSGTFVVSGDVCIIVTAVGNNTEYGRIAKLVADRVETSPIQQKSNKLVARIAIIVVVLAILALIFAIWRGLDGVEALHFALALTVSAVPESLPITISIILALGMRRMAKKKALVTNMRAIETIGAVNIIATDKTGTLTENQLTLQDTWQLNHGVPFQKAILRASAPSSLATDPLDIAMLGYLKLSRPKNQPDSHSLIKNYPFDQKLAASGNLWSIDNQNTELVVKGEPENILKFTKLSQKDLSLCLNKISQFGQAGFRVVALARKQLAHSKADLNKLELVKDMEFLGFILVADAIREQSQVAVGRAQKAGIDVRIITGDHATTALTIAQKVGVANSMEQVLDCRRLDTMTNEQKIEAIHAAKVFARAIPENKYDILEALKKTNIIAMTGDGVNDVPALYHSHVGIAMGSGSEMAQAASDIILLDNNFKNIVVAVGEGRLILNNIRRVIAYLLSTNLGEAVVSLSGLLIFNALPVSPIQILWINVVTDSLTVVPLGLETAEDNLLKQKPLPINAPLLSRPLIVRMLLTALVMSSLSLSIFAITLPIYGHAYANLFAFVSLVIVQWANTFNFRSFSRSIFKTAQKPNPKIYATIVIAIILQIMVIFVWPELLDLPRDIPFLPLVIVTVISFVIPVAAMEIQKKIAQKY